MDRTRLTDAELMDLIRSRDAYAFDAMASRYGSVILRHVQSIVHDADAAADLLQETFLRLWTRCENWERRGTVKSWLFKVSTNLALNSLRAVKRRRETLVESTRLDEDDDSIVPGWMVDTASQSPEEALAHAERRATVRTLLDRLPEGKRELIRLVYESEMEVREAAEALGIPEGTAKSRLHYSTRYLAREWRTMEDESDT